MPRLMLIVGIVLASSFGTARAQTGPDYLFWTFDSSVRPIQTSVSQLGLDGTITEIYDTFITELDRRQWPLIIIRRIDALSAFQQQQVIDRLEDQLDGGARLLVHLAELEDMPLMQDFLGLKDAIDLVAPKQFIREARIPVHPAAAGSFLRSSGDPPVLDDFGDRLVPGPGSRPIFVYDVDDTVAAVLGRNGQIIINGWECSEWASADGRRVATAQIEWLISCPADLNDDGRRDLFDFLEFQSLFMAGDPAADWFDYDGELTVFDFLAYFDAFEVGCFAR